MSMDPRARAEFVNAYTRALISAWTSEEYAAKLAAHPHAALTEAGLPVPADAEIVVVRTIADGHRGGDLEVQVALWEAGLATNRYEFHIPESTAVDMMELSEGDLDAVTAGLGCCCPCCCCT